MNTFFLIFIGLPALEIFLMIKIGGEIGALYTIALIFLTAIIGVSFARYKDSNFKIRIINLYKNKVPIYEIISGASIALRPYYLLFLDFLQILLGFYC